MSKSVNKTKIPISELAVGMLVTGVDRPWYATPFLSHRMTITSESEIVTLKACGVKLVEIEVSEPTDSQTVVSVSSSPPAPRPLEAPTEAEAEDAQAAGQVGQRDRPEVVSDGTRTAGARCSSSRTSDAFSPSKHASDEAASSPSELPATPFEEELQVAQQAYDQARTAVKHALEQAKMGRAFEMEVVNRMVGYLADSILRNPVALASLSRLKSIDEYTYYHSVNTCVLAMALGSHLRMNREALQTLGLGVLLHDIGKTQVSAELLHKPGRLADEETEILKQHVMRGVEFLTDMMKLSGEVILPVLEHHERMDGSGYPHGHKRPELSEFGLIAGVVDVYDALTSDRPYRKAVSPHQALQTLYDMARRTQLDAACVERFIRCMGIYPVGSCVKLSTGEIGVVAKVNPTQTLNPLILIVRESQSGVAMKPQPLDLSLQSGKTVRRITEVLHPSTAGIVPNDVLDGSPMRTTASMAA
ncbi:metal-dependent phosphohydrolase [Nitrospira sp.]|nr:metal-dependent phosphohydrolase [Nitrospira sp.]